MCDERRGRENVRVRVRMKASERGTEKEMERGIAHVVWYDETHKNKTTIGARGRHKRLMWTCKKRRSNCGTSD